MNTPPPEMEPGEFRIDAYGSADDWERWKTGNGGFCLECIDGKYGISVCTRFDAENVAITPAELGPDGPRTITSEPAFRTAHAKLQRVEFLCADPPTIEQPFILALMVRAVTLGLNIYVRGEQERAAFFALLENTRFKSDGGIYPGNAIRDYVQEGPPEWDVPDLDKSLLADPLETDARALPPVIKDRSFVVQTSQEFNELMAAAADGHSGRNYVDDPQAGTRTHARKGSAFITRLALLPEEHAAGGLDLLNDFTGLLNADSSMMMLYISHLLAPPAPLPRGAYAGGWVDLNDVARKVGLNMRLAKDAEQARQQVWNLILFGARASVIGARSIAYQAADGAVIPTRIETPPWAIMGKERPIQPELFGAEVPMRVELVMSREWTALTARPETAQYLPFGEVLGSIPPGRPGGAWARVVGLAFLGFCRRNPKKVLAGTLQATRRELLDEFQPAVSPYQDLPADQPSRVVEYWYAAIHILVERGLVAAEGEAANDFVKWKRSKQGRAYGWLDAWLNEKVDLRPGDALQKAMEDRADRLPAGGGRRKPKRRR